ncbi:hypothetical protein P154DRAFT_574306 [Amniculicola lignicola CBS 123094]|uniref:Cupredoxin n=1 Tax=Amniculicola lignicola CBS 123094 TaxID=1392246 RepID=A0A6A5WL01_9PLEO|nr:hypothetical protein P154DRAFT_574306 [Amniculicola lignicola CBS 123094]
MRVAAWGLAVEAAASGTMEINQTPSATTTAPAKTHTVDVGNGDHKFKPDVTKAEVGDIVEFRFYPQNHSVVRAEYGYPCIPYEMTGADKKGFFTGFNAVDKFLDDPPKYQLLINDTSPIFFYCSAPGSCIDWAMVGAINPNSSALLITQRDLALNASYMLQPGEPFPAEGSPLPPLPSSTASPNPTSNPITKHPHSLSKGVIAGIVVGALSVCILAALLFFFIGRSRTLKQEMVRKASTIRTGHHGPESPSFMPPAYFERKVDSGVGFSPRDGNDFGNGYTGSGGGAGTTGGGGGVGRSTSHRSMGGTFDISPTTGLYTRTHEQSPNPTPNPNPTSPFSSDRTDTYKFSSPRTFSAPGTPETSHTHSYTSPWAVFGTGSGGVPLGPYGRQVVERGAGGGPPVYWPETGSRWKEYGLEEGKGQRPEPESEPEPVEMDASEEVERGMSGDGNWEKFR